MSEVTLLSMNEEEATVAEVVKTYKRAEIEEQYGTMAAQMQKDQDEAAKLESRIAGMQKNLDEVKARIQANSYAVGLYQALIAQFDKQFPRHQAEAEIPHAMEQPIPQAPAEEIAPEEIVEEAPAAEEIIAEIPVEEAVPEEVVEEQPVEELFEEVTEESVAENTEVTEV